MRAVIYANTGDASVLKVVERPVEERASAKGEIVALVAVDCVGAVAAANDVVRHRLRVVGERKAAADDATLSVFATVAGSVPGGASP